MIYDIRQTTTYRYASPVVYARHVLRLTPIDRVGQRVNAAASIACVRASSTMRTAGRKRRSRPGARGSRWWSTRRGGSTGGRIRSRS